MRQPNHLSSLLLWSVVAVIWLGEARVIYREIAWMLALLFIEVIVLSASRTGLLGMAALMGWGLFDRRLSRATRIMLLCSPLAYLALWGLTAVWAQRTGMAFGGEARLSGSGLYVSYSRYKIWWNSLALIAQHPWLGVGFGEFNFVWTLTPFPDRPTAFFDHAHNLMLQFGVELGIPLTLLLLGLMGYALWQAMRNAVADGREPGATFTTLCGKPADPRTGRQRSCAVAAAADAARRRRHGGDGGNAQPARVPALVLVLPAARGIRLRPLPGATRSARPGARRGRPRHRHPAAGAGADAPDPGHHAGALRLHAGGHHLRAAGATPRRSTSASPTAGAASCSPTMPTTPRRPSSSIRAR